FVHIADAVGGLKVEISDREAEAINVILESEVNGIMGDDPKDDFLPSGGTFLLNGKQALAYALIRYVGNADFERTERQRTVLDLMLGKLKHLSPTAVPKILMKAVPELKTNMTTGELYLLSLQTPVKLIGYDMQKLRLPADGTYSDQTAPDGQMVLAVDFDANLQLYLKMIHDAPQPEPAEGEVTAP
ncbi:MAG: LCP family protein, partial [Oscillospiraceae bacterium]|nr:LCP family protein [Oscillospiraceae bacterium]